MIRDYLVHTYIHTYTPPAPGMDQIGIFRRAASANVVKEVKQRYEAG